MNHIKADGTDEDERRQIDADDGKLGQMMRNESRSD